MAYWGSGPDDCDYAFDGVGAYIHLIVERMKTDMESGLEDGYPEQRIIASLVCLRVIGEQFPQSLSLSFGRRDLEEAKKAFSHWYELAKNKIPSKYRESIRKEADKEFALFEERILDGDHF